MSLDSLPGLPKVCLTTLVLLDVNQPLHRAYGVIDTVRNTRTLSGSVIITISILLMKKVTANEWESQPGFECRRYCSKGHTYPHCVPLRLIGIIWYRVSRTLPYLIGLNKVK